MARAVTIGEITALVSLTDKLSPGLAKIDLKLRKSGRRADTWAGKLKKMASPANIAAGAVAGLGAALTVVVARGLAFSKQIETATVQFQAFTGSAGLAEQHIRDLTEFAASTPFQLPGILAASRMLKTFGADGVYGASTLRVIGDAAAGVSQPLQDVSMWVGRMYTNLKGGQPIGEATARLQEMGLLSGPALNALRGLAKEGGRADEAMQLLRDEFSKHEGGMKRLSETTAGLESTFADLSDQSAGVFVDAIGLTDTYRIGLKVAGGMMRSFVGLFEEKGPRIAEALRIGDQTVAEWRAGLQNIGRASAEAHETRHAEYMRRQREYALEEANEAERLAREEAERVAKLKVDRFWARAEAEHLIQQSQTMARVEAQGIPLVGGMGSNFADAFNAGMVGGPGGLMETLPPGMELVGGMGIEALDETMVSAAPSLMDRFTTGIMGPMTNFINRDWKAGAKAMISNFANTILPGLGSLVGPISGAIGKLWGLFKKPSDAELAARKDVDDYERTAVAGLSQSQIAEAKSAGWASWEDAAFLIGIRDAYTAAGMSAAQAEQDVQRYWAAIESGDMATIDRYQKQWDDLGASIDSVADAGDVQAAEEQRNIDEIVRHAEKLTDDQLVSKRAVAASMAALNTEVADQQIEELQRVRDFIAETDWAVRITYSQSAAPRGGVGVQARAAGGPVAAGAPYLVGERGPEIVVPASSGTVIPSGGGIDYRRLGAAVAEALRANPPRAVVGRDSLLSGFAHAGANVGLL